MSQLIAALIGVIGGYLIARLQNYHHKKTLRREEKKGAYLNLLRILHRLYRDLDVAELKRLVEELATARSEVSLFGSDEINNKMQETLTGVLTSDVDNKKIIIATLSNVMRKEIEEID